MRSISVIVPIYYGKKYIPGIIRQVEVCREYLEQEDQIEIFLVNDSPAVPLGSGWKSETVDITVIDTDSNVGIHSTRLKGLTKCNGEYVLFLDQDDRIKPEYFNSQLKCIGEADAVICKALSGDREVYTDDRIFKNLPSVSLEEWNQIVSPGQVLIRKDSIPDMWTTNVLKYNGADDWLLWICMSVEKRRFALNDEILYEHILQDANASGNLTNMLRSEQELLRLVQNKKIVSCQEFELLMEGFFKLDYVRIQELHLAKKKLEVLEKLRIVKKKSELFFNCFSELKIHSVAIYGCSILGEYLYDELRMIVDIRYFIDKRAAELQKDIPVYTLQEYLPKTDCVIVTLVDGIKDVVNELENRGFKNIIILKDWLIDLEGKL